MRLFDCHCHLHLSPRGLNPLLQAIPPPQPVSSTTTSNNDNNKDKSTTISFAGAAIMSTHPRDYTSVDNVVSMLRRISFCSAVPCYGIHPWFLHEVEIGGEDNDKEEEWLSELRTRLVSNPDAIVGEIGLDGARWREVEDENKNDTEETTIWERTRILSSPMNLQRRVFEQQLYLASELQRPVSIHVVKAWGELFDSIGVVRDMMKKKYAMEDEAGTHDVDRIETNIQQCTAHGNKKKKKKKKKEKRLLLPPKIYFHAFSGKAGVISSLLAACEKGNVPREDVFFGFAPVRIHTYVMLYINLFIIPMLIPILRTGNTKLLFC